MEENMQKNITEITEEISLALERENRRISGSFTGEEA